MKKWTTLMLARAGVMAALYVALTFACIPVASGAIQFRISEMLTILPLFYIEAIPALFIGCMIGNIISGCALWDIALGSLTSLVAAILTYIVGRLVKNVPLKLAIGGLFPVALNAFFLPLIWWLAYGEQQIVYWINVAYLPLSPGVIIWILGSILYVALSKALQHNVPALAPVGTKTVSAATEPAQGSDGAQN